MTLKVQDIMTRDPVTVEADWPVRKARDLARELGLRRMPVLDGGTLVGIITDRDLRVIETISGAASFVEKYHDFLMRTISVRQAMTPDPHTVVPDTDLVEVARMTRDLRVGGLPVVEDGLLVGMITRTDLIGLLIDLLAGSYADC